MSNDEHARPGAGDSMPATPPRERLVRANPEMTLRTSDDDGSLGVVTGHFAPFSQPTEIKSAYEGHFFETIAPGAFTKTLRENGNNIKVLFQHGRDPSIGQKPLGKPTRLDEDGYGGLYEVPLYDTSYNRDLVPGIRSGDYGTSIGFSVVRDDFNKRPTKSDMNPDGIPERTIREVRLHEFSIVTFPAYAGATAGMRSMTDDYILDGFDLDRLEEFVEERRASVLIPRSVRMDTEDISTLAQMLQLGACYIGEQDEPADQANVPVMQSVIKQIASLVPYEVQEDEGDEPEDEENSAPHEGVDNDASPDGEIREVTEPEPSEVTTQSDDEPEPPEATTRDWRELLWLTKPETSERQ